MSDQKEAIIKVKNLRKKFDARWVLKGVDLNIYRGETMVIMGGSGCGKSTLLRHLIGAMKPEEGRVILMGQDLNSIPERGLDEIRKKFGMLFQGAALFDSLTVLENVAFSMLEKKEISETELRKRVREKLSLVGLSRIEQLKPAELSGGMRKRVGLARALFNNPSIILYDEPTTGLDPIMADVINDLIKEMNERFSVTSIAVTHDMVSAYKIADRIAMLYEGKIIEVGTPDEIKKTKNPIVSQFINGQANGPIKVGASMHD